MKTNESLAKLMASPPVKPWLSVQQALKELENIGLKIDIITMIRIAKENNFGFQPRGRGGKWFLEREAFEQFKKRPAGRGGEK